jgi:hypothetical protein
MNDLACCYAMQENKKSEAKKLWCELLELKKNIFGDEDFSVNEILKNLDRLEKY